MYVIARRPPTKQSGLVKRVATYNVMMVFYYCRYRLPQNIIANYFGVDIFRNDVVFKVSG